MEVKASLVGGLPRPRSLAKAIGRFLSGKIGAEKLEEEYRRATLRAFRKMVDARVTIVTDGMFRWDDLFTPFSRGLGGVEENGLYRFFDNNFYYRVPVVKSELSLDKPLTVDWFKTAKQLAEGLGLVVKPVLPGPLTFACLSMDKYYGSREELAKAFARVVLKEAESLEEAGASIIEVHEPSLVDPKTKETLTRLGVKLLDEIAGSLSAKVWVQTYFSARSDVLRELLKSSVGIVALDLVEGREEALLLSGEVSGRAVALGVVDSRNTKMERVRDIVSIASRFAEAGASEIYLCPNCMMDFLPEIIAFRKLRRLGRAVRELKGV